MKSEYIVSEESYSRPPNGISSQSQIAFQKAMDLEVEATKIYNQFAEQAKDEGDQLTALFLKP